MDDLLTNIQAANKMVITDEEIVEDDHLKPIAGPQKNIAPKDLYAERQKIGREYEKKQFPRGARAEVLTTVQAVINGIGTSSLSRSYEYAKDNSEVLDEMGDHRRAQMTRNQYMQERFLPAVEIVVNFTSPDELLNSKQSLKELDKYALGTGSMSGYTEAYIRNAYGDSLGRVEQASSPEVTHATERLHGLLDSDQMVTAKGLAKKIKKKIDKGETISSEADYKFISTVASS